LMRSLIKERGTKDCADALDKFFWGGGGSVSEQL